MGWKRKRVWSMVMAVLLLFLCGCGGAADAGAAGTAGSAGIGSVGKDSLEGMQDGSVYVAEYQSLDGYCESVDAVMLGDGQKLFFTGVKDGRDMMFSLEIGEGSLKENPPEVKEYPLELGDGVWVSAIGKDTEGNLLLGLVCYQGDPMADGTVDRVVIRKVSPEGEELETVDMGNRFRNEDVNSFFISNLFQDKEGNYYISAPQEIYVLHPDGSVYFQVSVGAYISTMFVLGDGRVVAGYYGGNGWNLEEVDLSQKGLKPLESSIRFGRGIYRGGLDTDLAYTQDSVFYTCNLADGEPVAHFNWMDCNIDSNNLKDFAVLPDGRIVAVTIDFSAGAAKELSILTKKERSDVPEKKVLTYAALTVPYYTERDIVAFNKQSDRYSIEVKVYGDDSMDYGDRIALLNADLASGQAPDIIDMSASRLSLEDLVSAGVAEDLMPYLEGDDEVAREDFLESAMKAYERDGKLYAIMSSFGIGTMVGKVSDVGEGSSWSVEEMAALLDSKEKGVEMIEYADKNTMLWLICMMNQGVFVDGENGSCDFTDGEFVEFLEFANRFPKEPVYDPNGLSQIEKIRNGRLLLVNGVITSVELYQLYEYEFGEPVNFIGFPTAGEGGQLLDARGTAVAMHAASPNKEGVWEFIKFYLSEERQENLNAINGDGFPVRKSALDKLFEEEMEEEYYEDADGNRKVRPKNTWAGGAFGELNIDAYAATKEQVERMRLIMETAQMDRLDGKVAEIILEEAQAYFDGSKSAEDVAGVVQNRVQTYLDERAE